MIISAACWRPARLPAGTEEQLDFGFGANVTPPQGDKSHDADLAVVHGCELIHIQLH